MNHQRKLTRRELLAAAATLGGVAMLPRAAWAADPLVAATFPGTWSEAQRTILKPAFEKATGASVTQSIILGTDQVSRLIAAKGQRPPFDVAIFDSPQVLDAVAQGLITEFPMEKSANFKDLLPPFQDKWGPKISMQVIGIAYNPKTVKTPPRNWSDLWDAKYKGRVGLTALNSQLGIAFLAELNRVRGGTDVNFDPAFKALRELLPSVGAVAANLGAYATLWQQEQIDIAPYNFNFVQTLKGKGVPVEFVVPETGAAGWDTSLHIVANTANAELALKYIDLSIDAAVQAAMMKPPFDAIPTNSKVELAGDITTTIAKTSSDLGKIRGFDWAKLNPQRGALIERFNREIRT